MKWPFIKRNSCCLTTRNHLVSLWFSRILDGGLDAADLCQDKRSPIKEFFSPTSTSPDHEADLFLLFFIFSFHLSFFICPLIQKIPHAVNLVFKSLSRRRTLMLFSFDWDHRRQSLHATVTTLSTIFSCISPFASISIRPYYGRLVPSISLPEPNRRSFSQTMRFLLGPGWFESSSGLFRTT